MGKGKPSTRVVLGVGHQGLVPLKGRQVVGQAQSAAYLCCPIELQAVLQLEFIILGCYHRPGNIKTHYFLLLGKGPWLGASQGGSEQAAKCTLAENLLQKYDKSGPEYEHKPGVKSGTGWLLGAGSPRCSGEWSPSLPKWLTVAQAPSLRRAGW